MKLRYYHKLFFISLLVWGFTNLFAQTPGVSVLSENDLEETPANQKAVRYIGYDVQDSLITTSAIATIKGTDLQKTFNVNLANKLFGRLPGLTVFQGSNEPGSGNTGLLSRGVHSYQPGATNQPLVIVDGFPSFEQLTSEEIEEISLLKDASATAVYGMRAANGVLLVTTKRGIEGPLKVNFSSQLGFNDATSMPKPLNSYTYVNLVNEAYSNDGKPAAYTSEQIQGYQSGSNPGLYPSVNWYDQVFRKSAPMSNYNLNLTGGDKTVKYFALLNAVNNQGLYKNFGESDDESSISKYGRYNFRTNIDVNVTSRFSASLLLGGSIEERRNPGADIGYYSTFSAISSLAPNAFPVYLPDNATSESGTIPGGSFGATQTLQNPLAKVSKTGFTELSGRAIQTTFKVKHELDFITKGLSAVAAISFSSNFQGLSSKTKQVQTYYLLPDKTKWKNSINDPDLNLRGSDSYGVQDRSYGIQGFLNYNRTFGRDNLSAMLMINSDNTSITPFPPSAANTFPYKSNGGAGRLTYVNNSKYIAEFSFGYMGTETFPDGNQYGFFPAGSIGWIASNESFLKDSKAITFLKLKGSYGMVGNQNIGGRFLYERKYPYSINYDFGDTPLSADGLVQGRPANPNLTWEKEKQANFGVEATVFNQFKLSLDVFKNQRYDMLPPLNTSGEQRANGGNVPNYLGFQDFPLENIAKVDNNGFEASLGFVSKAGKKFSYFAEANLYYSKSKIVSFDEPFNPNPQARRTGHRIDAMFGLRALGLYTQADLDANHPAPAGYTPQLGDVRYADLGGPNGSPDGIIDNNDETEIGVYNPDLNIGLHTGFQLRGFDLDLVFQGATGRDVYLGDDYYQPFTNSNLVASSVAVERWTPQTASTAVFPRLSVQNTNNHRFSSLYMRNGNFIKLRSAELGYSLPKALVARVRLNSGRLFVNGTNLFSIDKINYGDPESLGVGYPSMRSISFGFKVGF